MIKSLTIALIGYFCIILAFKYSEVIHWPLLVIMVVAMGIGYINPTRGWIFAIALVISLLIFGFYFESIGIKTGNDKITQFMCYISFLPILFGGFMGKYFYNALK